MPSTARHIVALFAICLLVACSGNKNKDLKHGMQGEDGMADPLGDVYGENNSEAQNNLVAEAGDRVFFETDSHELTSEARSVLDAQAQWLQNHKDLAVTIEGHADERGTREYNLALGERRAQAARNYLAALGADSGSMQTISYGKERPAVPGSDEEAWALNRRAVTKVD